MLSLENREAQPLPLQFSTSWSFYLALPAVDKLECRVCLLVYVEAKLLTLTLCFSILVAEMLRWSCRSLQGVCNLSRGYESVSI